MNLRKLTVLALLGLLLLLLAVSLAEADSAQYYVIPGQISLRECASPDCAPLLTVYQGEKVEILERTDSGWSKVKLVDRSAMGWIPSNLLTYSPGTAPEQAFKFVRTDRLLLREHPRSEARSLTTLRFNDRVEMLGVSSGWAQVRELRSSMVGWVQPRYLSSAPSASARVSAEESADRAEKYAEEAAEESAEESAEASRPRRRAPVHKAPPKKEKAPLKKEEAPKEAPAPPKAM